MERLPSIYLYLDQEKECLAALISSMAPYIPLVE